jgi:hypothetical protein
LLKVIHRVNRGAQLREIPNTFGVEVDLRQWGKEIIVEHDAFAQGESFKEWLTHFQHEMVILNIKSEGIEFRAVEMLLDSNPEAHYFLLDQSFPFMVKSILGKSLVSGIRVSDIESFDQAAELKPKWIWLDCHLGDWSFLQNTLLDASKHGINTCLASPELHGRQVDREMAQIKEILNEIKMEPSAVCTKNFSIW